MPRPQLCIAEERPLLGPVLRQATHIEDEVALQRRAPVATGTAVSIPTPSVAGPSACRFDTILPAHARADHLAEIGAPTAAISTAGEAPPTSGRFKGGFGWSSH